VAGPKRPVAVWLIFLFYVFSLSLALLSFVLFYAGVGPLDDAQKAYFAHVSIFDNASSVILAAINTIAAILLFRLRKTAVPWIAGAFALNLGLTLRAVFDPNWIKAIGAGGLAGDLSLFIIGLAIMLYAIGLRRRGILR
jgi:hypothetical protein